MPSAVLATWPPANVLKEPTGSSRTERKPGATIPNAAIASMGAETFIAVLLGGEYGKGT